MDILDNYINTVIAINEYIHWKEHQVNDIFIREVTRKWNKGDSFIDSYPLFRSFYLDLLWKEYVRQN